MRLCMFWITSAILALAPIATAQGDGGDGDGDGCGPPKCSKKILYDGEPVDDLPSAAELEDEPDAASDSWKMDAINWHRLSVESGLCGPITPGPGCQQVRPCKLVSSRGTVKLKLISKMPRVGGTTGPLEPTNPPWKLDPDTSPDTWCFEVTRGQDKEIACGSELDFSFKWKRAGTTHHFKFKIECTSCEDDGEPPQPPV